MESLNGFLSSIDAATLMQLQFFAVAAVLSTFLFSAGFFLGRSSRGRDVKVPIEVLHALATPRFDVARASAAPARAPRAKESHEDAIEHEVEALLDHIEHKEKDFKHAHDYALHEIDRIIHDHGETPDLKELRKKVAAAHNIPEIIAGLKWYIERHHH